MLADRFLSLLDPPDRARELRMGTIPADYVAGSRPQIVFDGETQASAKRYPVVAGYSPRRLDRVVLARLGSSYVVLGAVRSAAGPETDRTAWSLTDSGGTWVDVGPGGGLNVAAGAPHTIPAGERVRVRGTFLVFVRFGAAGSIAGRALLRLGTVVLAEHRLGNFGSGALTGLPITLTGDALVDGGTSLTPNVRIENDSGSAALIGARNVSGRMAY